MRTITHMIQTSPTIEDLQQLGLWIQQESVKFEDRYSPKELDHLRRLWAQRRSQLTSF